LQKVGGKPFQQEINGLLSKISHLDPAAGMKTEVTCLLLFILVCFTGCSGVMLYIHLDKLLCVA